LRHRGLAAVVASAAVLSGWGTAQAQQAPPTAPILRVESPMHTALVRKLIYDARRDRIFTASDDKTVRVWQLPKGRLVRVLRVPIAAGFEGRLYVVDIHPDGRTVAAGGWTGWDFDGKASIYLFDVDSGELVRRISGFPDTIGTLAFSPDGGHLVVGLQGAKGLRVLRTSDYAEVKQDTEYGDRILDLGFAPDGRLVAASLDGYIRLYDQRYQLIGRRKTTTGQQPLSIKFSPNGRFIGVGFSDLAPPAIYLAADLTLSHSVDASSIRDQRRLQNIQWSDTGDAFYATGEQEGTGAGRIYRWGKGGRGPIEVIDVPAQRPGSLWPLTKGRMAFSSEDPALGILEPSGAVRFLVHSDIADLRLHTSPIRLASDASAIEFHVRRAPALRYRFSLRDRSLERAEAPSDAFAPPRQASTNLSIDGWRNGANPTVNGVPLKLDDYEISRSFALSPDDRMLVLGTEWSVRAYDRSARARWHVRASGVVWQVAVSPDGRTVVAALSDGTLRWLRAEDGVEYLALFVHPDSAEWIAWTPQGYYLSSNNGDQYIGWHLNRGREGTPLFYRAVQFERLLYRPDIVDAAFRTRDPKAVAPLPSAGDAFDVTKLAAILPPVVRLTALGPATEPGEGVSRTRLRVEARAETLPMNDLTVFVNNIPVTPGRGRPLHGAEAKQVARELVVELPAAENTVRVEISNGRAMGVGELVVDAARPAGKGVATAGDLYALAIGVNQFPFLKPHGKSADLDFAARDAEEFARFFRTHGPGYFRNVFARSISDGSADQPTRDEIVRVLDFLSQAGERDTVVLFLASHGVSDQRGNYYFVPRDGRTEDWLALERGASPGPSLIPWTVFFDALRQAAGRRILIVDTCRARDIEGRVDLHSLAKRSASSLFSLVAAAKGNEDSQEYATGRHGLFTYALLEALRSGAKPDAEGHVTLGEAFQAALPIVDRLHDRRQGPQTPQLIAPRPLDQTVLIRRTKQ
jgi:WD40 repeat protein